MEKAILAAYTPPLRNKVREPAGSPTPFGWAYPVLVGAVDLSGRRASADWGRALPFPLPLTQSGNLRVPRHPLGGLTRSWIVQGLSAAAIRVQTGEGLCPSPCPFPSQEGCGPPDTYREVWGRAPALPLAPYPELPLSPLRRTAPLTQGSRSDPSVRCGGQLPLRRGAEETLVLVKGRGFSAGFRGRGACGGGLRWRGRRRARSW